MKDPYEGKLFLDLCSTDDHSRRGVHIHAYRYRNHNQFRISLNLVNQVAKLLQKFKVQENISFQANMMNPLQLQLNEYTLAHINQTQSLAGSWGDSLAFLKALAGINGVSLVLSFNAKDSDTRPENERVFYVDPQLRILHSNIPDGGG